LISRSASGNQVFYQANRQHPAFPELRALLEKTLGAFAILQTALARIAKKINVAFIYGSIAKHEETAASDIDLMIIGSVSLDEVLETLESAERAIGRAINPTIYSVAEFRSKLSGKNHFVGAVVRGPKIFLIGGEDELGRIARGEAPSQRTNEPRRNQRIARNRGA
jgi:predicted nucleotidyltransferase